MKGQRQPLGASSDPHPACCRGSSRSEAPTCMLWWQKENSTTKALSLSFSQARIQASALHRLHLTPLPKEVLPWLDGRKMSLSNPIRRESHALVCNMKQLVYLCNGTYKDREKQAADPQGKMFHHIAHCFNAIFVF